MTLEAAIAAWAEGFDAAALARRYAEDDGAIVLPTLLPPEVVAGMAEEASALAGQSVRKHVPLLRKAGAVHHHPIVERAPTMHALHQSPSLLALLSRIAGIALEHRDPGEAHASALYTYSEPGDFMDWHYDECGCEPGDSFSTVVGVVDDSTSRLEIQTHRDRLDRAPLLTQVHTVPGTFAFFCGTRAYHRVTPLAAGQRRVTFAFTYVRAGRRPGGVYEARLKLGNALVYFGLGHLFERGARPAQ